MTPGKSDRLRPHQFLTPLVVSILAFALPASAETVLPPIGGPGGAAFTERCAPGRILFGLELTVGDSVDSARPICADVLAGGQAAKDDAQGPRHGGPNRLLRVTCPINLPAILSLRIRWGGTKILFVNSIRLFCGRATQGPQIPIRIPAAAFDGVAPTGGGPLFHSVFAQISDETQNCPKGQIALGVNGRSGTLLDALGLVCGLSPKR